MVHPTGANVGRTEARSGIIEAPLGVGRLQDSGNALGAGKTCGAGPTSAETKCQEEKGRGLTLTRPDILAFAWIHVLSIALIFAIGDFPTQEAAAAWAAKHRRRGWLKYVGSAKNDAGGRPVDCFCNGWVPKFDNLRHELIATRACVAHPGATFRRGYDVHGTYRPDFEMRYRDTLGEDQLFYGEIDCGTMKQEKVRARWRKYRGCTDTLLAIAASNPARGIASEARMGQLMRWSADIASTALFTTMERLQDAGPFGRVWSEIGEQGFRALRTPVG